MSLGMQSLLTDVLQSVCGPGPEWRKVEMVVDKGERVVFKEKFADFQEGMDISVKPQGNVQRKDKTPYVTGAGTVHISLNTSKIVILNTLSICQTSTSYRCGWKEYD